MADITKIQPIGDSTQYELGARYLTTARTLWGQSFNGTANISGNLTGTGIATSWTDTWSDGTNTHPWYGLDMNHHNTGVYSTTLSDYFGLTLKTASGTIHITSGGNVGIGTTSPSYKLSVNGDISATNFRGALIGNASSATKATQDGSGNTITSKYVTVDTEQTISNHKVFYTPTAGNNAYADGSAIQIREVATTTTNQSAWTYAPKIGFHWGGRYQGTFGLGSNGQYYLGLSAGQGNATLNCAQIVSSWNNSYEINATNTLAPANSTFNRVNQVVAHNTVQPALCWSNQVNAYGYVTRYSISSIRPTNGAWGRMRIAVGNNDAGSSIGCYMDFNGAGRIDAGVALYGAVWNDYAEMRNVPISNNYIDRIEKRNIKLAGRCVREVGDDTMVLSTERMQPGCKIISDTFGFNIGETDDCKTPIAVSGRALVYIYEGHEAARYHIGQPVCSGPDGTVSIMTDEEYAAKGYCCVGTISAIPEYETWGSGNIQVDGRIWIYVR